MVVPLSGFENDIKGLRALIDLALRTNGRPAMKLEFASTAGVFRRKSPT